jgi:hypothetical protein
MLNPRSPCLAAAAGLLIAAAFQHDAAAQSRGGPGSSSGFSFGAGASPGLRGGALSTSPSTAVPSSPATTPGALPPSAVGTPAPQVAPVAPLSPPTTSTFLGGGDTTVTTPGGVTTTVTTPGGLTTTVPNSVGVTPTFPGGGGSRPTSASPSESAPSTPGGGAPGLQACMGFWDAGTHMTKSEWSAACRRTENRLSDLKSELNAPAQKSKPGAAAPRSERRTPAPRARVSRQTR